MAVGSLPTRVSELSPHWDVAGMGLDDHHIGIVGFLFDEKQVGSSVVAYPVGTFFLISVPLAPDDQGGPVYLITALHVVQEHNQLLAVIKAQDGGLIPWKLTDQWIVPDNPAIDLAIYPLPKIPDGRLPRSIWPFQVSTDALGVMPKYGERTFFIGLLSPIKSTWDAATPVVRHGTLAAPFQTDITWGPESEPDKWGPATAHLIDCRSWVGFSGSPCFSEASWPGPLTDGIPKMPERWVSDLKIKMGLDEGDMGGMYYFHTLMGVFVGYAKETSIGIVLPVEYIRKLLEREDVMKTRKEVAEIIKRQRTAEDPSLEMSVNTPEVQYSRADFLTDLRRVTRRTDTSQSGPEDPKTSA